MAENTRIWITVPTAARAIDETIGVFYYLVHSGHIPHRYLKTNAENLRGICIVPMPEAFAFGILRLAEKTRKGLPGLQRRLRELGMNEAQIKDISYKQIEITEQAIQRLRQMSEQVLSLKGNK